MKFFYLSFLVAASFNASAGNEQIDYQKKACNNLYKVMHENAYPHLNKVHVSSFSKGRIETTGLTMEICSQCTKRALDDLKNGQPVTNSSLYIQNLKTKGEPVQPLYIELPNDKKSSQLLSSIKDYAIKNCNTKESILTEANVPKLRTGTYYPKAGYEQCMSGWVNDVLMKSYKFQPYIKDLLKKSKNPKDFENICVEGFNQEGFTAALKNFLHPITTFREKLINDSGRKINKAQELLPFIIRKESSETVSK